MRDSRRRLCGRGLIDTVVDGITGLHVRPRDPEQLAAALRMLRDDEVRRFAMGSHAIERVGARYSWARIARETAAIYSKTIKTTAASDAFAVGT